MENIVLVGDGYVGKTSIVKALQSASFNESSDPNIINVTEIIHNEVNFNIIDTAGQEEYDHIRKEAYEKASLFLLCFCISDQNSFDNITSKWARDLERYKNVPKILVGTKCDLVPEIKKSEIDRLKKKINCLKYIECSAKQNTGLQEILETAKDILKKTDNKKSCTIQ